MDKCDNSGPSQSNPSNINNNSYTQTQQKYQNRNQYKSRQHQVERDLPFKDLRELLNHKRQNADGKSGGPPSDPKYNYLSDPMRDGDSFSNTTNGTFKYSNQRFNHRNPSRGGRGRGNYTPDKTYHQKPGHSNELPREWDQGKEDPRNRRYNTPKNVQSLEAGPGPSNHDPSNFRPPQRYHDNTRPMNTNYKGPPHKYNPNYRGGSHQRYPPRRHQHPDPVNITIEYNVEDGFRKCTALDVKLDKTWKKGPNKKLSQKQQPPKNEDEENWDEDAATSGVPKIGEVVKETEKDESGDVGRETPETLSDVKIDEANGRTPENVTNDVVGDTPATLVDSKNGADDAGDDTPKPREASNVKIDEAKEETSKNDENEGATKTPKVVG